MNAFMAFHNFAVVSLRLSIVLSIFVTMSALVKGQNPSGFETMLRAFVPGKVDTVSSLMLSGMLGRNEVIVFDAREYNEFAVSHIKGAIHVGYNNFDLQKVAFLDKKKTIVVYCSIGKRSEDVAAKLSDAGFTDVYNHWGGIFDWTNSGYPVVNNKGDVVNQVHPYNTMWGIWVNKCEKVYEPR